MSFWRHIIVGITSVAFAVMLVMPVSALDVPPRPSLDRPIVDTTRTLTEVQITDLAQDIATARQEKSFELGVLIIPSLQGEPIEDYSLNVARGWGIGDKNDNTGALLLVAKDDRKIRIEVGYGLEGALNDARAGRIIRDTIAPEFREARYYEGIKKGIAEIWAALDNKPAASAPIDMGGSVSDSAGTIIFFGLWIIPWMFAILARTRSWWAGGVMGGVIGAVGGMILGWNLASIGGALFLIIVGFAFDYAVSKNYKERAGRGDNPSWWAGGSHWGGGSGGRSSGGSFGGGSFGGGGASGNW